MDLEPLSLEDSWRLRVVSAKVYSIVRNRDVERFENVLNFLEETYRLLPRLVTPIKHMKIVFGLKTMVWWQVVVNSLCIESRHAQSIPSSRFWWQMLVGLLSVFHPVSFYSGFFTAHYVDAETRKRNNWHHVQNQSVLSKKTNSVPKPVCKLVCARYYWFQSIKC